MKSLKNQRRYTGSSYNVSKRLTEHNSGRSTYTRATKPFILLYTEEYKTRSEAVRRERFLKSGKGRRLLKEHLLPSNGA